MTKLEAAADAFMKAFDGDINTALEAAVKAYAAASWLPVKDVKKENGKRYLAACVNRFGDFAGYYVIEWSQSSKGWLVSNGRAHMGLDCAPHRLAELHYGFPGSATITATSIGM